MRRYMQDLQREDLRGNRLCPDPGFFACLAQGDGEQILLPVGVPAEPGPGLVEIVIGHQDLRPVRIHDPA